MARKVYTLLVVALLTTGAMAGPTNRPPKYKYPQMRVSNQVSKPVEPEVDDLSDYSSKCDLLVNLMLFFTADQIVFINTLFKWVFFKCVQNMRMPKQKF